MQKKLLVLDLNGALIYRPKKARNQLHRRPYLSTFTSFLFHPETMKWMDTMVWSSAQPHNVARMVSTALSPHEPHLLTVWARDKMGLTPGQYRQKVQTTKDLRKIWAKLTQYSESTTLLLDDSPAKAFYQPHNHICLSEYASVSKPTLPSSSMTPKLNKPTFTKGTVPAAATSPDDLVAQLSSLSLNTPPSPTPVADKTLLAIIGILSKLKDEENVQEWIKAHKVFDSAPISPAIETRAKEEDAPVDAFWWTDSDVLQVWIRRGEDVVKELGIELEEL